MPATDAEVETAGWGSINNLEARPDKLKEVDIEVVSRGLCKRSDYFGRKLSDNMICAHKVCDDACEYPVKDSCDVSLSSIKLPDMCVTGSISRCTSEI